MIRFHEKRGYLLHYWSDKGFKGTIVNLYLQDKPLEIMFALPLFILCIVPYTMYTVVSDYINTFSVRFATIFYFNIFSL